MAETVYVLAGIMAVFAVLHIHLIRRYYRTKEKPNLYFGIASFFFVLPAAFGILIALATALDNLFLARIFYQFSTTTGMIAYVFLNLFAIAMREQEAKTRGLWISVACFSIITFIVWTSNPTIEGGISGTTEFTLTSMYKPPYGLPLIETTLVLMVIMGAYPIYSFFHIAKKAKEKIIKIKSSLMGIGSFTATIAYSIEVTDAISYVYMPFYRAAIFAGIFMMSFGYLMPKWIEIKLVGYAPVADKSLDSIVEKFFMPTSAPNKIGQPHAFSKSIGLKHQQIVGRKILLEFDPASNYEQTIQKFVNEALANEEPVIVFTRCGSTLHSSLRENKTVRFCCLTQQTSVPKEVSESEMLLPSNDTALLLSIFDRILKTQPEGAINIVFDNLSDLVLAIGLEKTYNFSRYAVEILASSRITALFLINEIAHDAKVLSSLRGLFSNQISFGRGGIQAAKLLEKYIAIADVEEEMSTKVKDE